LLYAACQTTEQQGHTRDEVMGMEEGAGKSQSAGGGLPDASPGGVSPSPAGSQAAVTVMHWSVVDICARSWG